MKRILSLFMAFSLLVLNMLPAFSAAAIADVGANYWAAKEIRNMVDDGVMTLNAAKRFNPEAHISRVDFVNALLVVTSNQNLDVTAKSKFRDVTAATPSYENILRSQQLGLVYGYPDGTFKPTKKMLRSEAQSVISHITQEKYVDTTELKQFKDYAKVPAWANQVYAKTLHYGIYVNYPDSRELRPNDNLTRAEAAVLLARLKDKLGLLKDEFNGAREEHLKIKKDAPNDIVKVTPLSAVILEGNVLAVGFDCKFKSKEHNAGDTVYFTNGKDINTEEGTLLIPANSRFTGTILDIKDPRWFNKNARVYIQLSKVVFPDGKAISMNAKPFYKDYALKESAWMNAGRIALSTVTMGAIGTGAGIGFGFIPDPARIGTGIAIGAPIGATIGFVAGVCAKGLNYNAKEGERIYVILLDNLTITK
jgi:hypothetical protein